MQSLWSYRKHLIQIVGSLTLALLLLWLLGTITELDYATLLTTLQQVDGSWFILLFVSTTLHFSLSAFKWWFITSADNTTIVNDSSLFYLFYTALGALLGQFIPLHISVVITRGIGLRLHQKVQFKRGVTASIYEQGFDVLIPLILAITSVLILLGWLDWKSWLFLSLFLLILSGIVVMFALRHLLKFAIYIVGKVTWLGRPLEKIYKLLQQTYDINIFGPKHVAVLFTVSVVRFVNLILRAVIVVWATGLDLSALQVAIVMPLSHLSTLIPLTPGNLGIVEWTWTGILTSLGTTVYTATYFGLLYRLLIVISVILTNIVIGVVFWGSRFITRKDEEG